MREVDPPIEEMLRLLAEHAGEHAVILLNPDGNVRWWNETAERVFNLSRNEAVGTPLSAFFTRTEAARGEAEHELLIAQADTPATDDRWLVRADGSRFWAAGAAIALRDRTGRLLGFGKILRDRTDLKEQIETLRNRVSALEDAGHRKDVFLSTLSHELRNPLEPLSTAVHLMRATLPSTTETEFPLRVIERQVDTLRRLVDDLLDLARIGAGKIDIQRRALSLHDVIRQAVESSSPLIRRRQHQLQVLLPEAPTTVTGDSDRLVQVFVNLLNNAAKFTPEQGRIWIKSTTEGDEVVVHVQDNGIGIPGNILPKIFELFTQVEPAQSQGGLGIGLSLVKTLVTLHGGSVQVESYGLGRGSTFSVRLPLLDPQGQASLEAPEVSSVQRSTHDGRRSPLDESPGSSAADP